MRPQVILTIISGELKGKRIVFDESTSYTIGRAKNCNLCFEDSDLNSGISRYHCLLEIDPPRVYIRDLGSTNGTLINGRLLGETEGEGNLLLEPTVNHTNYQLQSGDEIDIGDTVVKLEILLPEAEIPTPVISSPVDVKSSPPAKKPSLKKLAVKGASWTIIGYGLTQLLRFGSNVILTRLLTPDLFGLMTLVNVIYLGLNFFSDFGINQSVIQNSRGQERSFLNTAWTIQVIRGVCLWLACVVVAFPAASFYNEPTLRWLVPVIGLNAVIAGFNSTSLALMNRELSVGKLTIIDLGIYIIQITITIVWAKISPTIWSLIIGWLISTLLKTLVSHFLNRKTRDSFGWDRTAFKEMFRFGSGVFFSSLLSFVAAQTDKILIPKLFSVQFFGVYVVAAALSDIPRLIIARVSNFVIFPLVSKQKDLPRQVLQQKLLKNRKPVLLASAALLSLAVGFGDLFILSVYDSRYHEAAWIFRILSLGLWQTVLYRMSGAILTALGNTYYYALGSFSTLILLSVGLPTIVYFKGLLYGVILIAIADIPQYFILNYGLYKERLNFFWQDAKYTLVYIGLLAATQGLRNLILN